MSRDGVTDLLTRLPVGGFRRREVYDVSGGVVEGGTSRGLSFQLVTGPGSGKTHSIAALLVFFAGDTVWSTGDRSYPDEVWGAFLSGLARAWLPLCAEQTYPHGTTPRMPSRALDALLREIVNPMDAQATFAEFRRRHDVSSWFAEAGVALPSLYALREGQTFLLETGDHMLRWHVADVLRTLERLGDAVDSQLAAAGTCSAAREAWRARDEGTDADVAAMVLGIDAARARGLESAGVIPKAGRHELLRGLDEVRVAARMLAAKVGDEQIGLIADLIRSQGRNDTPALDRLCPEASGILDGAALELPRVQGQRLATWLRTALGMEGNGTRVDPEDILRAWGVPIVDIETEPAIEAVCFWGESRGPAILLNRNGRSSRKPASWHRSGYSGGARATLAHEICHLLVDRRGALPAAEVLGGSVPYAPEERARSFAAEFLLPREFAGETYRRSPSAREAVETLSEAYRVSWTVAAWQILNRFGANEAVLPAADRRVLHEIAEPNRSI